MVFDIRMLPEVADVLVLCGLLTLGVGLWQYYESKNSRLYRLTRNIPGPPSLPLLGNVLDFKPNTADFFHYLTKLVEQYGPVTKMWLGSNVFILLSDPRNIESRETETRVEPGPAQANCA
uniref:Cytochrome P450 n=1 Tax=Timema shepardi TaxID=629360 RepID=A0A7R9ASM4_TIMSH|nr:unnamed protein product [Timema shepardi]